VNALAGPAEAEHARGEQPFVLIIEGLISPPLAYRPLRDRLLARGAVGVDLAPVHVHDWIRAGVSGFGALQERVAKAIQRAHEHAGGRPILMVGHSGGGNLARLAMCDVPYRGRVTAVAPLVGCVVTLGTPHALHESPTSLRHQGVQLSEFLERSNPGAWFAPTTGYVTVASDAVRPRPAGSPPSRSRPLGRLSRTFFRRIVGPLLPTGSDGVVSAAWAHLPGATNLTYHDVLHGVVGGPWYGDAAIVDRWWPVAVEAWRVACVARDAVARDGVAQDVPTGVVLPGRP
jgi:hypothetical protein